MGNSEGRYVFAENDKIICEANDHDPVLFPEGGGDGGLFKGVFIRYFTRLIIDGNLSTDKKNNYIAFLKKNAESLWSKGTNKALILFGNAWDKAPGNTNDLTIQLSGIMLMEALAELKKLNLLK